MSESSQSYNRKKNHFDGMLTIYGRKSVLEAIQDKQIPVHRIHLADSNKPAKIIQQIEAEAQKRNIAISYTDKLALSRISRNSKQDQGVAADLALPELSTLNDFLSRKLTFNKERFIALDRIHNPQNLGMIIRSVAAGGIDALFLPRKGCTEIGPLAIKASAGSVFKCPIVRCDSLEDCLEALKDSVRICTLDTRGDKLISDLDNNTPRLFVLGNESEGISPSTQKMAHDSIRIPLANGVESLNVAMTAALIAFMSQ